MRYLLLLLLIPLLAWTPVKTGDVKIDKMFLEVAQELGSQSVKDGGTVNQNLTISSAAVVSGDLAVGGDLTLTGDMTVNDLTVSGDFVDPNEKWVNFIGTGTVVMMYNQGVASVADTDTGDYTITFDEQYETGYSYVCSCLAIHGANSGVQCSLQTGSPPTSSKMSVTTHTEAGAVSDADKIMVRCIGR